MAEGDAAARGSPSILGLLSLVVRGEERPVAGEKLQALLARLLLDANHAVSTERLIDELWGDEPPATARQSPHVHVGRLRRFPGDATGCRRSRRPAVATCFASEPTSPMRFASVRCSGVRTGRANRGAPRRGGGTSIARRRASARRGAGWIALPWAEAERARLDVLRFGAIEELVDIDLQLGRSAELVPQLEQLVQKTLREQPARPTACAVRGRPSGGRPRRLPGGAATLDEVGLQPGPRLRELEQAILRQDPAPTTSPLGGAALRSNAVAGDSPASPSRHSPCSCSRS